MISLSASSSSRVVLRMDSAPTLARTIVSHSNNSHSSNSHRNNNSQRNQSRELMRGNNEATASKSSHRSFNWSARFRQPWQQASSREDRAKKKKRNEDDRASVRAWRSRGVAMTQSSSSSSFTFTLSAPSSAMSGGSGERRRTTTTQSTSSRTSASSSRNENSEIYYEYDGTKTKKDVLDDLERWLVNHGVRLRSGDDKGDDSVCVATSAKTVEDLAKELERGETVLVEKRIDDDDDDDSANRALLTCARRVSVVVVEITRAEDDDDDDNRRRKKLVEIEQTLPSGVKRKRNRFLSEKIMFGETPIEAAKRGIIEELGPSMLDKSLEAIEITSSSSSANVRTETKRSQSYFNLQTEYAFIEIKAKVRGLPDQESFVSTESCGTTATWKWV
jgi:hypothetical protein